MTNEIQQTPQTENKQPIPFGNRLKTAREAMGLDRKDAAAQLRLSEKIILMMEKDRYPTDMPVTFIRGYIRAYGKLLQIPDYEIKKAIEPIKPKPVSNEAAAMKTLAPLPLPVTSGNYFMQFFTYLILMTMIGLVGMWWYTHNQVPSTQAPETQLSPAESQSTQPQPMIAPTMAPNPPPAPANAEPMMSPPPVNITTTPNDPNNTGMSSEAEKKMTEQAVPPIMGNNTNITNNDNPNLTNQTTNPTSTNPSSANTPMSEDDAADAEMAENAESDSLEAD